MPFLIILIILVIVLAGLGYYFAGRVIYPKVFSAQETYQKALEEELIDEAVYKSWPHEEVKIRSPYGYELFARYHPVEGSKKTIVFSHGITLGLFMVIKYSGMFYRRGWNVLIYDLRNHGRSGGKNTTFGYYEKNDLKAVVDWAFQRLGPGGVAATFGESLGAGTTLQHAGIDPRIAFAIADCPYSDLKQLLTYRIKVEFHLPPWPLLPMANLFSQILSGFNFTKASPIAYIPQIETPIFWIHGKDDDFIPPQMSIDMYNAKNKGIRKLWLAPNAGHAQSFKNNQAEYEEKVAEFLTECGLN